MAIAQKPLKLATLLCCATLALSNSKGAELMEKYRKAHGHWIDLKHVGVVDEMVEHIGVSFCMHVQLTH
jgi:hypothetical protein